LAPLLFLGTSCCPHHPLYNNASASSQHSCSLALLLTMGTDRLLQNVGNQLPTYVA
jgi:hypothetical protein